MGDELWVESDTRQQIRSYYRAHADSYDQIWSDLEAVRERFEETDRDGKIARLKLSYVNAVISIRTTASKQDEALSRLVAGDDLETALASVNYHTQKRKYMRQSLQDDPIWDDIALALQNERVDRAHETALELGYIGTVKAPFILSMLGYTEKMCIDGNALNVLGLEDYPSMDDVTQYEQLCQNVRAEFPVLSDELDPFHLHWVVFDWQRSTSQNGKTTSSRTESARVTRHEPWFDAALRDVAEIEAVVEEIA